jgi:hypothetical protein
VDYFFDSAGHVCDDVARQLAECQVSCAEAVSCVALRGEDEEEQNKLFGCMDYCSAFIFQVIRDEEGGR